MNQTIGFCKRNPKDENQPAAQILCCAAGWFFSIYRRLLASVVMIGRVIRLNRVDSTTVLLA